MKIYLYTVKLAIMKIASEATQILCEKFDKKSNCITGIIAAQILESCAGEIVGTQAKIVMYVALDEAQSIEHVMQAKEGWVAN